MTVKSFRVHAENRKGTVDHGHGQNLLVRKSSMPPVRQRSRSSFLERAVRAMTGKEFSLPFQLTFSEHSTLPRAAAPPGSGNADLHALHQLGKPTFVGEAAHEAPLLEHEKARRFMSGFAISVP
jgi:hypothetical protein